MPLWWRGTVLKEMRKEQVSLGQHFAQASKGCNLNHRQILSPKPSNTTQDTFDKVNQTALNYGSNRIEILNPNRPYPASTPSATLNLKDIPLSSLAAFAPNPFSPLIWLSVSNSELQVDVRILYKDHDLRSRV